MMLAGERKHRTVPGAQAPGQQRQLPWYNAAHRSGCPGVDHTPSQLTVPLQLEPELLGNPYLQDRAAKLRVASKQYRSRSTMARSGLLERIDQEHRAGRRPATASLAGIGCQSASEATWTQSLHAQRTIGR